MYTDGTMNIRPKPRQSARVLILRDGNLLTFLRKRHSRKTGEWIEYYSIPGGGIDKGETAEQAAVRELQEEMGIQIALGPQVAHSKGVRFEHFVFTGKIIAGEPHFAEDSEEAMSASVHNQFIVTWVAVDELTPQNLRYYGQYYDLIVQLARGEKSD